MTAVRRIADVVMGSLGRLLVRIFFREIEVQGSDQIASDVPTVLIANHLNGLVDGLLLMATLRRFPRFLGKSTLFRILPLWPFLKLAGVVPVYRAKDGRATTRNTSTFRTCRKLLARGGLVALFPEGISHDEPELQPLKTGAARIALGASVDDGVAGVVVQPVGIVYDEKARFRSVALVRVGPSVAVERWADQYRIDDHQAVRELTAEMAKALAALSPAYASWSDASMFRQIADVLSRGTDAAVPLTVAFSDRDQLARALAAADGARNREDWLALRRAFSRYSEDLEVVGLTDAQLAASYRGWWVRMLFVWSVVKIACGAPFALGGAIVHLVPYEVIKQMAKKPTNEGIKATVKLLGCFATFTLLYVGIGVAFALNFGTWEGLVAGVGAPACGYVTVRFSERVKRLGGALAGYRVARHARISTVRGHRAEVVAAGDRLLALGDPSSMRA
jgi:glycerol-3-phosphate O-acyltransferase / dihydroxyacetone phosphate acyltransferase